MIEFKSFDVAACVARAAHALLAVPLSFLSDITQRAQSKSADDLEEAQMLKSHDLWQNQFGKTGSGPSSASGKRIGQDVRKSATLIL